jgi:hypothetical protein
VRLLLEYLDKMRQVVVQMDRRGGLGHTARAPESSAGNVGE